MSTGIRIVGITLVRNEDRFVERAVRNALPFCDAMILADHGSTDDTNKLLQKITAEYPDKCSHHRLRHSRESHVLIKPFAGTSTWIFAVDGDEIYEPGRLAALRARLLAGELADNWLVLGNVLHAVSLDEGRGKALGHLCPPSRSITKLYNFSAIESWDGDTPERLHGGSPVFRPGYGPAYKKLIFSEFSWDDSPFRCLHLCFCRRSSAEKGEGSMRENLMEINATGPAAFLRRLALRLRGKYGKSGWKREKYRRGPIVTVNTGTFFTS